MIINPVAESPVLYYNLSFTVSHTQKNYINIIEFKQNLTFGEDKQYLFLYPLPPVPTALYVQQLMVELFCPVSLFLNYNSAIVCYFSPLSRNEVWLVVTLWQLLKQNTSV